MKFAFQSDRALKKGPPHFKGAQNAFSSHFCTKSSLELVLQRKLDQPWIGRAGNAAESGRPNVAIGIIELRMIGQVEELRAEFDILSFRYLGSFKDREIPIIDSGTVEQISSQGTKSARALICSCP